MRVTVITVFSVVLILTSCSSKSSEEIKDSVSNKETINCIKAVKYRTNGLVDVCENKFIKLNISSIGYVVMGTWYDIDRSYMIIQVKNTNYHYCSITPGIWDGFKSARDLDDYYVKNINDVLIVEIA